MPKRLNWIAAVESVMSLTYPPTVLAIPTARAAGHRLARAIIARGNQPSRPIALVDGLAVLASDIVAAELARPTAPAAPMAEEPEAATQLEDSLDLPPIPARIMLTLRAAPSTNRKEEALAPGQAISVPVGGEVPRGGELVYPLSELVAEPVWDEVMAEIDRPVAANAGLAVETVETSEDSGEDESGPITEPAREWDLPAHFRSGTVELPRSAGTPPANMVPIGSWAHNREPLLPEKTVLRPPELALLLSLGVDEVDVFRRPVVGVVSLGLPFPVAGQQVDPDQQQGICPLAAIATYLARAARVAALPLGFAPKQFHLLVKAVKRWVQQVDILLLVGGSHHGPNCRGLDVLRAAGEVVFSGVELTPGGDFSAGKAGGQPVLVMPGTLPDVLTGTVLLARPLMHKYLTPHLYEERFPLALDHGSQLTVEQDTALPVRFSFDYERKIMYSRYTGSDGDPWLDYIRGQALVVLEGGRAYTDGEVVTAYRY